MGGFAIGGAMIANGIAYTVARKFTNDFTVKEAKKVAQQQMATMLSLLDKQGDMWDKVSAKQIASVETAVNEFILSVDELLPTFKDAYPDVPVAARLVPPVAEEVQFNQMVDNIKNLPKTAEYMQAVNHWHRINYANRAEFISPGFVLHFKEQMRQLSGLAAGQIPLDEAVGVTSDAAENAAMLGRIGNTCKVTAASMGIRRLQMQQLARGETSNRIKDMQMLSPIETEALADNLMIKPERRMAYALELAQLIQNDLQNFNNAAAQKAPYKMAQLQAKLQRVVAVLQFNANKANMQNQFVPNFPALMGPLMTGANQSILQSMKWDNDWDSNQLDGSNTPITSGT